jgi:hypothetical protein
MLCWPNSQEWNFFVPGSKCFYCEEELGNNSPIVQWEGAVGTKTEAVFWYPECIGRWVLRLFHDVYPWDSRLAVDGRRTRRPVSLLDFGAKIPVRHTPRQHAELYRVFMKITIPSTMTAIYQHVYPGILSSRDFDQILYNWCSRGNLMTFPSDDDEPRSWLRGRSLPQCWAQKVFLKDSPNVPRRLPRPARWKGRTVKQCLSETEGRGKE